MIMKLPGTGKSWKLLSDLDLKGQRERAVGRTC